MLRAQPLFSQQGRAEQRELLFGSKVEKTEGTAVGLGRYIPHVAGQYLSSKDRVTSPDKVSGVPFH